LHKKKDLDGLLLTGAIDETFLKQLSHHTLPYLVLGNFKISPRHPSIGNHFRQIPAVLAPYLADCNDFAAVIGPESHADERLLRKRIEECFPEGMASRRCRVLHAGSDGAVELERLWKDGLPDVLFFPGEHVLAWRRLLHRHRAVSKPFVIISRPWDQVLDLHEYNQVVDWHQSDLCRSAIEKILSMIVVRD